MVCLLGACAALPPPPAVDSAASACLRFYHRLDQAVAETGTIATPSRPAQVHGFPYLRVNRFLAGYRDQSLSTDQLSAWLVRMARLDRRVRALQLAALNEHDKTVPAIVGRFAQDPQSQLDECIPILLRYDRSQPRRLAVLRRNAVVATEYRTLQQVFGWYPLTAIPVSIGVRAYHRETRETFAKPLRQLPVTGRLRRFDAASRNTPTTPLTIKHDALGIPEPGAEQLAVLFARHAPVWEIDVAGDFDLPGVPVWRDETMPAVDTTQAVTYRYPSYTRWQGQPLLQLNYLIWFSERPRQGRFDILGGPLDGLIWRVTLQADGEVLLYDSIHPCGCYHYLFAGADLRLRAQAADLPEPPLLPQPAPQPRAGQRIVIRLASATHYIQRVYADEVDRGDATIYSWRDYADLYRTPDGAGARRSLFAADGLVRGSERGERWILWPMGVASPGAMRERGRHAIAFVGRRHFDDADLLEALFEPAP